jgi:hypothetical protein
MCGLVNISSLLSCILCTGERVVGAVEESVVDAGSQRLTLACRSVRIGNYQVRPTRLLSTSTKKSDRTRSTKYQCFYTYASNVCCVKGRFTTVHLHLKENSKKHVKIDQVFKRFEYDCTVCLSG